MMLLASLDSSTFGTTRLTCLLHRDRFHDVTNEWEVWNEPQLGPDDYQPYAKLAAVTCQALYEGTPSSAPRPRIFYGTLSGG